MRKRIIFKYLLICLPFLVGGVLFSLGIYNLFSSVLFFVGGYVALKNLCDYRKINKNVNSIASEKIDNDVYRYTYKTNNSVVGLKRTHRHELVRKRVKK